MSQSVPYLLLQKFPTVEERCVASHSLSFDALSEGPIVSGPAGTCKENSPPIAFFLFSFIGRP